MKKNYIIPVCEVISLKAKGYILEDDWGIGGPSVGVDDENSASKKMDIFDDLWDAPIFDVWSEDNDEELF